jgi:DNA-binding NarL/FixJ family response regulator
MKLPYKILIVEDHPAFAAGLCSAFEATGNFLVVGVAHSGTEALCMKDNFNIDLVVMDLKLPDTFGLKVIEKINQKGENREIPVLVLSNYDKGEFIFNAVEIGVRGFLPKTSSLKQIIACAQKILHGQDAYSDEIQSKLLMEIKHKKVSREKLELLTSREKEIFIWLGEGYSDAEIAQNAHIQKGTVRSHISNILQKMEFATRSQAVIYALENQDQIAKG